MERFNADLIFQSTAFSFCYRDDFYLLTPYMALRFMATGAPGCEVHTNFADESVSLTADNIQNEVVIIHRPQEVLKILPFYM
jgi:hypothetical protein